MLRASGPELASGKPGGRIGSLNMSWGLLDARVFPGGLLLNPVFMPPLAILKSEITGLRVSKPLLGSQYVEIHLYVARGEFADAPLHLADE